MLLDWFSNIKKHIWQAFLLDILRDKPINLEYFVIIRKLKDRQWKRVQKIVVKLIRNQRVSGNFLFAGKAYSDLVDAVRTLSFFSVPGTWPSSIPSSPGCQPQPPKWSSASSGS
jgi:hypothetical protein